MNNELRAGYAGGMVDVYIPKGENLYCYDVNSLYPYVMLQRYPSGHHTITHYKNPVLFFLINEMEYVEQQYNVINQ